LHAQIVSATSVEQNYYSWKDPHFAAAMNQLPQLDQRLDDLNRAVLAAQAKIPDKFQSEFSDCFVSIETAKFDVTQAMSAKDIRQYGDLSALLPVDSDDIGSVGSACAGELNQKVNDPTVGSTAAAVASHRQEILDDFDAIDQKKAAQKAADDIAFVNRTLNTIFKDLNLYSVGPIAVLDRAQIGPTNGALRQSRIGPGGGVRFELVSSVNFTLGYAWNVDYRPGEGKGALFFAINMRDLFH
jgi:hypothetical protein